MEIENNDGKESIKEKMNLTNIIINNTNRMNINNISIKNSFFQNLIPQRINSEEYLSKEKGKEYSYLKFGEGEEYYLIKKGNNFLFNNDISNYITKLCIKFLDFNDDSNSNKINIQERTKKIVKYLNDLIKGEWFVLINDITDGCGFEFSFSFLNEKDLIIFKYKNYNIYISLLYLKLDTDFVFENTNIKSDEELNYINQKNSNKIEKEENIKNDNQIIIKQEEKDNNLKNESNLKNSLNEEREDEIINKNKEKIEIINNDINSIKKVKETIEYKKGKKIEEKTEEKSEEIIKKIFLEKGKEEIEEKLEEKLEEKNDEKSDLKNKQKLELKAEQKKEEDEKISNSINKDDITKENLEKNKKEIDSYSKKNKEVINNNKLNSKFNKISNEDNINSVNNFRVKNIKEEKEDNKYSMKTFNYRFTNTRSYYKNKNKHKNILSQDFSYTGYKITNEENFADKKMNIEGKNIFSIYNMPSYSDENTNKPTDLIEPNNVYYLRQDIRINNKNIENNKQLYSNLQKKIKRMITNTKIPIFNFDNYKIIKTIGEGTYGQLYSMININTKKSYAMKELIATDINYFFQCLNTLGINYHNKHSNILDIYGIYVIIFEEKNFVIYALMDLAESDWEKEIRKRKELYKYYKEQELILILKQLVSALSFLQKRNIAHRDIKLENILLFPNKTNYKNNFELDKIYKIGDFGEAKNKIKYSVILNTIRGTDYYMSPELLEGINKQKDFIKNNPHKSDVFSLGCCMMIAATLNYEIISTIRNPKNQVELNKVVKNVLEKRYSKKFSDLITKMLVINENNRIDFINLEKVIRRKYL